MRLYSSPLITLVAVASMLASGAAIADGDESPPAEPTTLPPEILRIQQELGGSVVNQFPSLQSDEPAPQVRSAPTDSAAAIVQALRGAAWHMDIYANQLESLQRYDHADALREHAQRLRLGARDLAGVARPSRTRSEPTPAFQMQPSLTPIPEEAREPAPEQRRLRPARPWDATDRD